MRLLVAGGTGFIGEPLCRALTRQGHELIVLTRHPERQASRSGVTWLSWEAAAWRERLGETDGVINLAGEPIATTRWSARQKQRIRDSRLRTTRALVDAIAAAARRPSVLINASAVGYYGARGEEPLVESDPFGAGFLAELCAAWEAEAARAEDAGVRVVRLRIGIVLGPDGGALAKMVPPFRACVGGPLGSGRQWMSWIHRADVIGLIGWALTEPRARGAVNATAPASATMQAFCRELGRALHRPSWAPVPAALLRLLLGEMAQMLLTGQRVLPAVPLHLGYAFRYPELAPALASCLNGKKDSEQ